MNNNQEKTLVLIKPDAVIHAKEIIEIFYNNALRIAKCGPIQFDEELAKEHYAHLVEKPFFKDLSNYMMSGPVIAMVIEGENAVEKVRKLVGKTNPELADPGTIRKLFGKDITHNAIHASDSIENAQIEIDRFFTNRIEKEESIKRTM